MSAVQIARTESGPILAVSRTIRAPVHTVWELLVDTERWPEWGPTVQAVDSQDSRIETGSTGRIQVPGGLWLPFEIIDVTEQSGAEPGWWRWEVGGLPATGHRVEPTPGGQTTVTFELPLPAVGYVPVCYRALDRIESILGGR